MSETSQFLRLPAEIRNQIYGYLLSIKYTKHYPCEEDPEWEYNPGYPNRYNHTPRPTHVYEFHVGILGVNRKINCEASNVLYDQNKFVRLTSDLTNSDIDFKWLGVPAVAQGATASRFTYTVLHIQIKQEEVVRSASDNPMQLIFAGADIPAFCSALLLGKRSMFGRLLSINIDYNTADEENSFGASFSTLPLNLLEPLRLLHSFHTAHITGPLDERYKSNLCLSICKEAPSVQDSLLEVLGMVEVGPKAINAQSTMSYYRQAIKTYNTAMTNLKDRFSRFYWIAEARYRLNTASTADLSIHIVYTILVYRLRLRLASCHFQMDQWEQARKWSERAVEPISEAVNPLIVNVTSNHHYLKAFIVNARSNNKLGRWKEAVDSMEKAVKLSPSLAEELKLFKDDEKKHKENQMKTVRKVSDKS